MSYLTTVLISWIPTGITICIKILYEMVKSFQVRTGRMNIMNPVLKAAVEDTVTTKMDIDQLKELQKMEQDNPKICVANPREIKYKNTVS